MPNTVSVNVQSDQGAHTIFLQPDADNKRMVHALVDKVAYVVTECSASSDGATFQGTAAVKELLVTFSDPIVLTVDPVEFVLTMVISHVEKFSGIVSLADALALVAFIKSLDLPSLAG